MGVISLTTSVVQSIQNAPGGAAVVKEFVRKGTFDDDPQLKRIVEDTLCICDEESKKAAAKPAKVSQKEGAPNQGESERFGRREMSDRGFARKTVWKRNERRRRVGGLGAWFG